MENSLPWKPCPIELDDKHEDVLIKNCDFPYLHRITRGYHYRHYFLYTMMRLYCHGPGITHESNND